MSTSIVTLGASEAEAPRRPSAREADLGAEHVEERVAVLRTAGLREPESLRRLREEAAADSVTPSLAVLRLIVIEASPGVPPPHVAVAPAASSRAPSPTCRASVPPPARRPECLLPLLSGKHRPD